MGSTPIWGSEIFQSKDIALQSFTYTHYLLLLSSYHSQICTYAGHVFPCEVAATMQ